MYDTLFALLKLNGHRYVYSSLDKPLTNMIVLFYEIHEIVNMLDTTYYKEEVKMYSHVTTMRQTNVPLK